MSVFVIAVAGIDVKASSPKCFPWPYLDKTLEDKRKLCHLGNLLFH